MPNLDHPLLQPQLSKPNFCFYKLKHLAVILSLQKQNCCIEKVFVCACVHASKLEISLDGMNILGKICLHMSKCASIVQDMGWSITASWGLIGVLLRLSLSHTHISSVYLEVLNLAKVRMFFFTLEYLKY